MSPEISFNPDKQLAQANTKEFLKKKLIEKMTPTQLEQIAFREPNILNTPQETFGLPVKSIKKPSPMQVKEKIIEKMVGPKVVTSTGSPQREIPKQLAQAVEEEGAFSQFAKALNRIGENPNEGRTWGNTIGQGLEGIGAAIRGGNVGEVAERYRNKRNENVLRNPESSTSRAVRAGTEQLLGQRLPGVSAYDVHNMPISELVKLRILGLKGGGVGGGKKPSSEVQKEYSEYMTGLNALGKNQEYLSKLDASNLGRVPIIGKPLARLFRSNEEQAIADEIEKNKQPAVKALAGPGTIQESERQAFEPLLPGAYESSERAALKNLSSIETAAQKGLQKAEFDRSIGRIDEDTYNRVTSQILESVRRAKTQ
jgi:hypothetical protein